MRRRWGGWPAIALLVALAAMPNRPMLAQDVVPAAPAAEDLTSLSDDLDVIQRDLTDLRADGDPGLERRLQLIMQRSDQLSDDAEIRLARLKQQLAALGVAPGAEEPPEIAGQRARAALALIAIGPLAAALLGRGVLATYLYNRALAALVLIWAVAQFRRVVHAALRNALDGPPAAPLTQAPGEDGAADAPARIAGYWAAALVDIGLALLTLRVLLQLLEIPRAQIDYWTGLALGDIQIGNAVISLPNILLAILVLAAGLFGSSRLRRWLGKHVLPQSGMEIGLRTSIAAGAGYLAMILAFLAAIATAGISLSSVAIVAGALSVGMGFGLRTVVENFVAGLLMLIERPIRVGDWVVIGDTEGTVRRISVRATEIETFDAASVDRAEFAVRLLAGH